MSTSPSPPLLPVPTSMKVKAMKQELESYGMMRDGIVFVERGEIEAAIRKARSERRIDVADDGCGQSRARADDDTNLHRQQSLAAQTPAPAKVKQASKPLAAQEKNASSLSIKDLKAELQSYGIATDTFFDKPSLIEAVAKARSEGWRKPSTKQRRRSTTRRRGDDAGAKFAAKTAPSTTTSYPRSSSSSSFSSFNDNDGNNDENRAPPVNTCSNNSTRRPDTTSSADDPHGPLKDGEEVQVQGSGDATYIVRREGKDYLCNCMGWRFQSKKEGELKSCKHIDALKCNVQQEACSSTTTTTAKKRAVSSSDRSKTKRTKAGNANENKESGGLPVTVALAKAWNETDNVAGWYMSEKLDGMRCIWDGVSTLWSRNGNRIDAPPFFTDALPRGTVLDGELFLGRGMFQECMSIARRQRRGNNDIHDNEWKRLTLVVFDAPQSRGDFPTRLKAVRAALAGCGTPESIARVLPQNICIDGAHVLDQLEKITDANGEGVMLRSPNAPYRGGRVSDLLKVKKFVDAEAVVTGHEAGKNKHAHRMGAIVCAMTDSGKAFKIGTGFSDAERDDPPPVGCTVTYKYFELTKSGVPRFPVFVRIRPSE